MYLLPQPHEHSRQKPGIDVYILEQILRKAEVNLNPFLTSEKPHCSSHQQYILAILGVHSIYSMSDLYCRCCCWLACCYLCTATCLLAATAEAYLLLQL